MELYKILSILRVTSIVTYKKMMKRWYYGALTSLRLKKVTKKNNEEV